MTQVYLFQDKIIYSKDAEESIKTKIGKLTTGSEELNIYNRKYRSEHGTRIYTRIQYYRWIKALVEGKIDAMEIPKHCIQKENIQKLYNGKYTVVLYAKFLSKENSEELIERLGKVYTQMGIIHDSKEIFQHIYEQMQLYPEINIYDNSIKNTQRTANRIMKKHIDLIKDIEGYNTRPLGYDSTNKAIAIFKIEE